MLLALRISSGDQRHQQQEQEPELSLPSQQSHQLHGSGPVKLTTLAVLANRGSHHQAPEDGSDPYSYRYIGALVGDFHRTLLVRIWFTS